MSTTTYPYHAWFSQNQLNDLARGDPEPSTLSIGVFRTIDGRTVRATCTTSDAERSTGPHYQDMIYLGVVVSEYTMQKVGSEYAPGVEYKSRHILQRR